jgi:adenosylcobinamide-phosphate synthase
MLMLSNIELTFTALVLEALVGYPPPVYRTVGHPVTWVGKMLGVLDVRFNHPNRDGVENYIAGIFVLGVVLFTSMGAAALLTFYLPSGSIGKILGVLFATTILAQRSLYIHVKAVATALQDEGLEAGRQAVSMIVGRNPASLDEFGVARAAIESLAENYSDGVVAPAFWLAIGSLPGAVGYKTINTADSMIGHRTARYLTFGWAAARLDDLVNLPASKISIIFLALGAFVTGTDHQGLWRAVWRDAHQHRSPNAGWPEAAMAGALGLRLAGPRRYDDTIVDDAYMGDGRCEAVANDILRALRVYRGACIIQAVFLALCMLIERA